MSRPIFTPIKNWKAKEIVSNKFGSFNKFTIGINDSNNATIETTINNQLKCTCKKKFLNFKKINLKKNINIYSSDEKQIISTLSENINSINTTISNNSLQVQITESDDTEKIKQKGELREVISWSFSDLIIQVMERLQYLAAEPPQLFVQFPIDLMINRTINNNPIKILIPIPDYYIQQQDHFEVFSKEANEVAKIAEVTKVAKFGDLGRTQFEIFIQNKIVEVKEPLVQEKHDLNIIPSQRTWKNPVQPVKTNKLTIEEQANVWNNLIKPKDEINIEFKQESEIKPKEEEKEIIIPKPQYSLSEETQLSIGGKGFKPKVWSPIPSSANSLTIEKEKIITESSSEGSYIVNDDYNKPKEMQMRSVIITIMKINEEEEASTECLDVLQNIIISKININIEKENNFIKSRFEFNEKRNSEKKYEINFKSKNKMFNKICK